MTWTKVTDAPPPDGEALMVTVEYSDGTREVWGNLKWNNSVQNWDWSIKGVSIHYVPDAMPSKVTHWTPMPAPAEDE